MIQVFQDAGKVIVDLAGRRRDVLLSCAQAHDLAEALDSYAAGAERADPSLVVGDQWGATVQSFDGKVAIRFYLPGIGHPDRVPIPPKAARILAEKIRTEASWAEHKMRLIVQPQGA